MSLIGTLIERRRTPESAEGRMRHGVPHTPRVTRSTPPPMSLLDEVHLLEKRAQEQGLSYDELAKIRQIGNCPAQVQTRIRHLHEWLATH